MTDRIDKRNMHQKIKGNVLKWWQVQYEVETIDSSAAEIEEARPKTEDELRAEEIVRRLEREALEDQKKLDDEIEAVKRQVAMENYNAATKSYSGAYGQNEMDEATKHQVDDVMRQHDIDFDAMAMVYSTD